MDTLVDGLKNGQTNVQTSSIPVNSPFIYFALKNTGACSSILHVKVSLKRLI